MKILRSYFWYVPTIIWMIMIFNMSGQVASTSQGFSLRVTQKIVNVIEIVRDGDEEDAEHLTNILHPYVRKAAHMNEYAILYTLLLLSFCASTIVTRAMFYSILVSFVYACTDEFQFHRCVYRYDGCDGGCHLIALCVFCMAAARGEA